MADKKVELVKTILDKELKNKDEKELIEMLIKSPLSIDVDKEAEKKANFGDKIADRFTAFAGSWTFIIGFSLFLISWILLNTLFLAKGFDKYPFILLNLLLSCIAALQAPIIMMSQNRQAKKESMRNNNDYKIDLKSELILEEVYKNLNKVLDNQTKILELLENDNRKSKLK